MNAYPMLHCVYKERLGKNMLRYLKIHRQIEVVVLALVVDIDHV